MRHYECECMICGSRRQIAFCDEPYPEYGAVIKAICSKCEVQTNHTRVLTKKTAAELRCQEVERQLRESISDKCREYGFSARFLYQSVIVTTALADWCFDYHKSRITLYHESTLKISFDTGNYAKSHVQFSEKKITPLEVVDYIAAHDAWRTENNKQQ